MSSYDKLIANLDRFIRKYYVNKLIKGSLYFLGLVVGTFLLFALLESAFYFSTSVRKVLFFSFLSLFAISAYTWILDPLLRYTKLGKQISREQAAGIVGTHFTEVKDKLLNVLQLKSNAQQDESLVQASILQKTDEIKLVPFPKAIDLSKNRKHLRFALPPLLILFGLLLASPSLIRDSSKRLIENNKEFVRPAPFDFVIMNDGLEVVQFSDFDLQVKTEGSVLPNEVFIRINDFSYRLNKNDRSSFAYTFRNVKDDIRFSFFSGNIESQEYTLKTLLKPQISNLEINLTYPGYTRKKEESVQNSGDLVVPEGTEIAWKVDTRNVDDIEISHSFEESRVPLQQSGNQSFIAKKQVFKSGSYQLYISNRFVTSFDSVSYSIQVVPDRYPTISVVDYRDSTDTKLVYFQGQAEDDYGLRSIRFQYQIKNDEDQLITNESVKLNGAGGKQGNFDYLLNVDSFDLSAGDKLTYYFEVFDNDGINGSKSSRTSIMEFRKPTKEEYEEMAAENSDQIKEELEDILDESKKLKQELKELREKLLSKKEMSWEDKKELDKLLEKQKSLDSKMNEARDKFNENRENQEEFSNPSEEIQQKQEKLDELFEESMDQETKDLMDKIQELLQEMQREDALEMMEDFNFDQQEMEMNTERLLELYKQLELEQQMMEQQQKLEELAEKQEKLSEETKESAEEKEESGSDKSDSENMNESNEDQNEEGDNSEENNEQKNNSEKKSEKKSQEDLKEEQEEIEKEFQEISQKLDELEKKNEELERPRQMQDSEKQEREIQEQMDQSQQQLDQNKNKKASESQKKASEKMKEMASQMQNSMMNGQMQQMQEDMKSLRQLLENLVDLSFDQEDLISSFSRTSAYTPKFVDLVQDQYKIKEDFKMVEDSLRALSKRVSQMESFIIDKVYDVNKNIEKSLDNLEERQKTQASDNQRRTMTNLNDLALMLSETMEQMQQQMSSMMPGQQMCNSPGQQGQQGQQPVPGDKMSEGQGELNKEIERWKKALNNSGKPGPGSKEFAQMASRQAELRKALQDLQKELREQGQGSEDLQQIIDQMNKTETELVNKQLTNETLQRQKQIMTRLLEAEKAERERKWDNKREAQTAQDIERKLPPEIEKYIKQRESEIEFYQTISPDLRPFYRQLVESYYQSLKQ